MSADQPRPITGPGTAATGQAGLSAPDCSPNAPSSTTPSTSNPRPVPLRLSPAASSLLRLQPGASSCAAWLPALDQWICDARQGEAEDMLRWQPFSHYHVYGGMARAVGALAAPRTAHPSTNRVGLHSSVDLDGVHAPGAWKKIDHRLRSTEDVREAALRTLSAVEQATVQRIDEAAATEHALSDEDSASIQSVPKTRPDGMVTFRVAMSRWYSHVTAVMTYTAWSRHVLAEAASFAAGEDAEGLAGSVAQPLADLAAAGSSALEGNIAPLVERKVSVEGSAMGSEGPDMTMSSRTRRPAEETSIPVADSSTPPSVILPSGLSAATVHRNGFYRHLAYLHVSHTLCRARLGLYVLSARFQRSAVLPYGNTEVVFVEVADGGASPGATLALLPDEAGGHLRFGLEESPNHMEWKAEYAEDDCAPGTSFYRLWTFLCVAISIAAESCAANACPSTHATPPEWTSEVQRHFEQDEALVRALDTLFEGYTSAARRATRFERAVRSQKRRLEDIIVSSGMPIDPSGAQGTSANRHRRNDEAPAPRATWRERDSASLANAAGWSGIACSSTSVPPDSSSAQRNDAEGTLLYQTQIRAWINGIVGGGQIYPPPRDACPDGHNRGSDFDADAPELYCPRELDEHEAFSLFRGSDMPTVAVSPSTMDWMVEILGRLPPAIARS